MKPQVAYADQRLDAWASWVRGNQASWPPRTLLARIIEEGAAGAAHGSSVESMPEVVAQTDRAVARIDQELRRVIKVYYLVHAPSEIKAARCHVSRATFWRRVERGQLAIYNQLQGETEIPYYRASLETAYL